MRWSSLSLKPGLRPCSSCCWQGYRKKRLLSLQRLGPMRRRSACRLRARPPGLLIDTTKRNFKCANGNEQFWCNLSPLAWTGAWGRRTCLLAWFRERRRWLARYMGTWLSRIPPANEVKSSSCHLLYCICYVYSLPVFSEQIWGSCYCRANKSECCKTSCFWLFARGAQCVCAFDIIKIKAQYLASCSRRVFQCLLYSRMAWNLTQKL